MEDFPKIESEFDKLVQEKETKGWHFAGREGLTKTEFQKDARFVEAPFQTEDDIKGKYLKIAKAEDLSSDYEVELVLDVNTDKIK